ncbi:MAG TPA: HetP family heterocyst commitment protein [Crinalium sp.]
MNSCRDIGIHDESPRARVNPNTVNNLIDSDQFTQIVEAILNGEYSWACVLILRSTGHDPLRYIPYRTYVRLLMNHR